MRNILFMLDLTTRDWIEVQNALS